MMIVGHQDPGTPSDTQLMDAARRLLDGQLVAFPTETVYGLGADAENPQAIQKIYAAKQRPTNHPLIVHLAPGADVDYWSNRLSDEARALMGAFWPGPLTLIVPRAPGIPADVSGGQPTIGLRCPSHPVARALLEQFAALKPGGQGGVAAPSANKFGHVSPTRAEHVRSEFPELDTAQLLVLEGGQSTVGIESTIIDMSDDSAGGRPVLLRPGHIRPEQIASVLGVMPARPHAASPQVSGSLKAHYAPRTPLHLIPPVDLPESIKACVAQTAKSRARIAVVIFDVSMPLPDAQRDHAVTSLQSSYEQFSDDPRVDFYRCSDDPDVYARDLYDMLRRLDEKGYGALLIQQPPKTAAWQAVNDRLGRAAAAFL